METQELEQFKEFTDSCIRNSNLSGGLKSALMGGGELAFYGAGMQTLFLLDFCTLTGRDVVCSVVSDAARVGDAIFERKKVPVLPIGEFAAKFGKRDDLCVIVAVDEKFNPEICELLRQNGIGNVCTVGDWKAENSELKKITKIIYGFMLEHDLLKKIVGVISLQAGSFKKYLLETNMPEKIARLKRELDADSLEVVDRSLFKITQNPEDWFGRLWLLSVPEYENVFLTEKERLRRKKCFENALGYEHEFVGLSPQSEELQFHHGLFLADEWVKEYVKGKDFLDCGSYDGGSAIVFNRFYQPGKIYSFDLSAKNCALYRANLTANGIPPEKYELVNCGVSDTAGSGTIIDRGGSGVSLGRFSTCDRQHGLEVPIIRMDDFVDARPGMRVGFVKCDLEGHGLRALMGMEKTIRRFRPVLSLAIYHCPSEFFETKPLLEEITRDLNYKISIIDTSTNCYEMIEISLFAYPVAE
jgi:FkbM family methyltransferase